MLHYLINSSCTEEAGTIMQHYVRHHYRPTKFFKITLTAVKTTERAGPVRARPKFTAAPESTRADGDATVDEYTKVNAGLVQ